MNKTYTVLFLCTGNSARSILAEAILNHVANGRFRAYSAGCQPTGRLNPFTLQLLEQQNLPTENLRSKSWEEFATPEAPHIDFIFTVCDNATDEACPIWPGKPVTAHWGIADPAAVEGTVEEKRKAFLRAYTLLYRRIALFTDLPLGVLDEVELSQELREIGRLRERESKLQYNISYT